MFLEATTKMMKELRCRVCDGNNLEYIGHDRIRCLDCDITADIYGTIIDSVVGRPIAELYKEKPNGGDV